VDFRKGHDGLAALVQSVLEEDPFTGTVFVFRDEPLCGRASWRHRSEPDGRRCKHNGECEPTD